MSSPATSYTRPVTRSDDEVLVRVEGVSKKFCRSLKKSLWYGVCDIAGELLPGRKRESQMAELTTKHTNFHEMGTAGGNQLADSGEFFEGHSQAGLQMDSEKLASIRSANAASGSPENSSSVLISEICGQKNSDAPDGAGLRDGEFFAVKDVSFELRRGECLGLIGHNGAGKTTLLKMLNGLIKPDAGSITMRGRVGALIALGAGFNPILTGRENIYINGSVLGLAKKEIDAKIDEIIDFADIGEFIDTPVQNYSSGMSVRLGFAVATAMNPDVLILDEVLAVGDTSFRAKCFKRIGNIARDCAIIFVSHDQSQVSRICTKAILMESGECKYAGPTAEVLDKYNTGLAAKSGAAMTLHTADAIEAFDPILSDQPQIVQAGSSLTLTLKLRSRKSLPVGIAFINFIDLANTAVGQIDFSSHLPAIPEGDSALILTIDRVDLAQGNYSLNLAIFASNRRETLVHAVNFAQIKVTGEPYMWCAYKMPLGRLEIQTPRA